MNITDILIAILIVAILGVLYTFAIVMVKMSRLPKKTVRDIALEQFVRGSVAQSGRARDS